MNLRLRYILCLVSLIAIAVLSVVILVEYIAKDGPGSVFAFGFSEGNSGDRWDLFLSATLAVAIISLASALVLLRTTVPRIPKEDAPQRQSSSADLLRSVAITANQASDMEEAVQVCINEICAYKRWPVGHVYELAADGTGDLVSMRIWHLGSPERFEKFRQVSEQIRFAPGVGLPGRVLASGKPAWINDVTKDTNFPRAEMVRDIGVKAGFAFPVLVGKDVSAVLEFFSEEAAEPDDQVLNLLSAIGAQLGRVIERKLAQQVIEEREQALQDRISELEHAQDQLKKQSEKLILMTKELAFARDEADAANRAKSEFLATVSHELRTPLNAIIGFSDMIADEILGPIGDARYRQYCEDINISGQHLLALINDILDLSKVEAGVATLQQQEVDVPVTIEAVQRLVREGAEEGGVELIFDVANGLPPLWADERKLRQILINLMTNAIKFTSAGGRVTLDTWCDHDGSFVFQITDTGIGIAPKDIPLALSQFGQIDGYLNRRHDGSGLGLPISKALMEQHGGSLDLQSELGVGTTVTVTFPAAASEFRLSGQASQAAG